MLVQVILYDECHSVLLDINKKGIRNMLVGLAQKSWISFLPHTASDCVKIMLSSIL
jgi:hypothetical protein